VAINTQFGSRRKALTYDIFCVAFAQGTIHGSQTGPKRTTLSSSVAAAQAIAMPPPPQQQQLPAEPFASQMPIPTYSQQSPSPQPKPRPQQPPVVPLPPLTADEALRALQQRVDAVGVRAVFDEIDANRSGRASADELVATLRKLRVGEMEEAHAEELIKSVNARLGSRRKALTYDAFCVAFARGPGRKTAPVPAPIRSSKSGEGEAHVNEAMPRQPDAKTSTMQLGRTDGANPQVPPTRKVAAREVDTINERIRAKAEMRKGCADIATAHQTTKPATMVQALARKVSFGRNGSPTSVAGSTLTRKLSFGKSKQQQQP